MEAFGWSVCIWFCKQWRRLACFLVLPPPLWCWEKSICIYSLQQWFLKHGFQTCSIRITCKTEMQFLGSHSRPTKIRNSRHGIHPPPLGSDAHSRLRTPAPKPCYSKWRPWACSTSIAREPVKGGESAKSQTYWPRICILTRLPGDSYACEECEKHCSGGFAKYRNV